MSQLANKNKITILGQVKYVDVFQQTHDSMCAMMPHIVESNFATARRRTRSLSQCE